MTRHILVGAEGVSVNTYQWSETDTLRLSWDMADLTIELPLLPDDTALRVSLAELRSWATARELWHDQQPLTAEQTKMIGDYLAAKKADTP